MALQSWPLIRSLQAHNRLVAGWRTKPFPVRIPGREQRLVRIPTEPANWSKTSRGFLASAALSLQRTARDKRAAERLATDASTTRLGATR
jgi:hypothetical protein